MTTPDAASPALDAVEKGAARCEADQCDGTVGFGGSPDESGETTLDAMIMDGDSMDAGAVGDLRHVKQAARAARLVMEKTSHTLLVGLQSTQFALDMGLPVADLSTKESLRLYRNWKDNNCQPNFRRDVCPEPSTSCGPYHLRSDARSSEPVSSPQVERSGPRPGVAPAFPTHGAHDTISLVAVAPNGSAAAACSTNGAIHKIPGRVGDGAAPGAGAYADSSVGACGATGDGDVHLRFLPCYQVVESMRRGLTPTEAAEDAIRRIARRVPGYVGAVLAVDRCGRLGAAAAGWDFTYSYRHAGSAGVKVVHVPGLAPESAGSAATAA